MDVDVEKQITLAMIMKDKVNKVRDQIYSCTRHALL